MSDANLFYADAVAAEDTELGSCIAQCGPQRSGQLHYIIFGLAMLAFSVVCFVAPWTFLPPKPGDEEMIRTVSLIAAAISALCGLAMLWSPLFGREQTILLYERGLVEKLGSSIRRIKFQELLHLTIQEWYEHRLAPRTFKVNASVLGQRDLSFSSALGGDSETIIAHLAEQAGTVETVPFA